MLNDEANKKIKMNHQNALFHVGSHKTATSSLQQDFFIPLNGFSQNPGREWILSAFVDKASMQQLSSDEINNIHQFIDKSHKAHLYPIISHERLSGYPYSGGYDRLSIYNRIKSLTGINVKILYIIREQKSWIYSAWKQLIDDGGAISIQNFLKPEFTSPTVRVPGFRLEYLNYANEIKSLKKIFGPENICVVPMELLINDFKTFREMISNFLNIDIKNIKDTELSKKNESSKLSSLYFNYFLNRTLFRSPTSPRGLFSTEHSSIQNIQSKAMSASKYLPELPQKTKIIQNHKKQISDIVGNYFSVINKETSYLLEIDLKNYGYDVAG